MASTLTPNTRTARALADQGILGDVVERQLGQVKRDWLTFADWVGLHLETGTMVAIQATSKANINDRMCKCNGIVNEAVIRKAWWRSYDSRFRQWINRPRRLLGNPSPELDTYEQEAKILAKIKRERNAAERRVKCLGEYLAAGAVFEIWGWHTSGNEWLVTKYVYEADESILRYTARRAFGATIMRFTSPAEDQPF